jgi:integrase
VVHDCGPNQSEDGTGWIEIFGAAKGARAAKNEAGDASGAENKGGSDVSRAAKEGGLLLTINGKTGWREVEIGRGSSALTCPVAMLETRMRLGRVADGPLFRRVTKKNMGVTSERLTDKHVARLVQKTAPAADIRGDLSEGERKLAFSGHSLRAGLASSAQIEEAHVQKHLGHASAEMTRRYQRKRDRFKVNLTRAAGL